MIMAMTLFASASVDAAPPKSGDEAPDYVGKTLDGDLVRLNTYRGKAVVISYWATWCPYCLKELPILSNIQRVVGKDRMQVIAINTESRDVFRKVTRALQPLDIQLAYDPDSKGRAAYGVGPIPHMMIIGRDGVIDSVHKGYGEESLDKIVAAINRVSGAGSPGREPEQGKE
jgi:peroxiredoxin